MVIKKKLKNSTIIIVLSWSKIFSVMLYSNCKLYDFKKKERMRESNNLKDRENGREKMRWSKREKCCAIRA